MPLVRYLWQNLRVTLHVLHQDVPLGWYQVRLILGGITRDKLHGTNGFLRNSAKICGLRKCAPPKCYISQEKRKSAKISENLLLLSLSVCPFDFPLGLGNGQRGGGKAYYRWDIPASGSTMSQQCPAQKLYLKAVFSCPDVKEAETFHINCRCSQKSSRITSFRAQSLYL